MLDRHWDNLLTEIHQGQVVPVIGPELSVVGGETWSRSIAVKLAQRLGLDSTAMRPDFDLGDLVSSAMKLPEANPDDLRADIRTLLERERWPTPVPLRQLAEVTDFRLFASVTIDSLLEQALKDVRGAIGGTAESIGYTADQAAPEVDLPEEFRDEGWFSRPFNTPFVYHLFGRAGQTTDFALTEEDILGIHQRLNKRDSRPERLFRVLEKSSLLILGCCFPGWLARFFLATARGESWLIRGIPGVFAQSQTPPDQQLVEFLKRRRTRVFESGDSVAFVEELNRRWKQRYGGSGGANLPSAPPPRPFKRGSVFISYASENRPQAQRIADQCVAAKLDVWFDRYDLHAGEDFKQTIKDRIHDCAAFVPVISQSTGREDDRFFWYEWHQITERTKFRPAAAELIYPVVIDDTAYDALNLPEPFKTRNWERTAADGSVSSAFIDTLREQVRKRRLDQERNG